LKDPPAEKAHESKNGLKKNGLPKTSVFSLKSDAGWATYQFRKQ